MAVREGFEPLNPTTQTITILKYQILSNKKLKYAPR